MSAALHRPPLWWVQQVTTSRGQHHAQYESNQLFVSRTRIQRDWQTFTVAGILLCDVIGTKASYWLKSLSKSIFTKLTLKTCKCWYFLTKVNKNGFLSSTRKKLIQLESQLRLASLVSISRWAKWHEICLKLVGFFPSDSNKKMCRRFSNSRKIQHQQFSAGETLPPVALGVKLYFTQERNWNLKMLQYQTHQTKSPLVNNVSSLVISAGCTKFRLS